MILNQRNFSNSSSKTMQSTSIIITSNLPCEIGLASLYHYATKNPFVTMNIQDSTDFEKTSSAIQSASQSVSQSVSQSLKEIIMIGTFWKNCLEKLLDFYSETKFIVYCFGEKLEFKRANLRIVSSSDQWPVDFILKKSDKTAQELGINGQFLQNIDDRLLNINLITTQNFYSGLENSFSGISLFDKFTKIFQNEISFDDMIITGKIASKMQVGMAQNRVLSNSKKLVLQDGITAAVTSANDLINLTHDALHQKYPDIQVTIVVQVKFVGQDNIAFSIRTYDPNVSARDLSKKINGDGCYNAAGGFIKHSIPFDF